VKKQPRAAEAEGTPTPRGVRTPRSLFPPFAGVALADILANSAAIVIIMIVVTLMARREEEEQKLEQAEDVSVLLSRELATSFVMNALPTSAPARLHDYVTWPPDRNPQHSAMPVVELHAGFLRNFYTGETYPRDELLRQDNAFDDYVAGLTADQRAAIRIDVYSIKEFYIAMSILKAHGVTPRHWHFLATGPPTASSDPVRLLAGRPRRDRPDSEPWAGDGLGTSNAVRRGGRALPGDVSVAGAMPHDEAYPMDGLGSGRGNGGPDGDLDLPPSDPSDLGSPGASASGVPGDAGAESGNGRAGIGFRSARPVTGDATLDMQFELETVLRGLFTYMRSVQADADAGRPSVLPDYNFERDILGRAGEPTPPDEQRLIDGLVEQLSLPVEHPEQTLTVVHRRVEDLRGQALGVPVNRPLYIAHWLRGPAQRDVSGEEETTVTTQLGLHPAIYQGLRVPLGQDSYVLMPPPAELPDPNPRWRVVTLVSARVDDFVTGFVYAAVDEAGRLRLPVDDNAIEIGGLAVESAFPPVAFRAERRQLLFYGAIAALFAFGLVVRVWRRA